MQRAGLSNRPRSDGPRPRDWVVAGLVVVAQLAPIRTGTAEDVLDDQWAASLAPALALGSGLPLAWRRVHPRVVAGVVLLCYAGLAVVQGLVPPWGAWVLIWSLASCAVEQAPTKWLGELSAAATIVLLVAAELRSPGSGALTLLIAVTAVLTLAAVLVRSERGRVDAVGRQAAAEERLRIARDLHDLVGHGLSAVAVQSSTARLALTAGDADTAQRALSAVESSSRTALRELRQMLGVLVDANDGTNRAEGSAEPQQPSPGVRDIAALVENVRAGGVTVALEQTGDWGDAPPSAQLCAYRVVQEGLTNAVKHAPQAQVTVRLDAADGRGMVSVETAGPAGHERGAGSTGLGLQGLQARVIALSGDFWSGPTPRGWLVEARLPLDSWDRS